MQTMGVLIPVEVDDDVMFPLRLVLLPASIMALGDDSCKVRLHLACADGVASVEMQCVVGMWQLVAGGKQVWGDQDTLEDLKIKMTHEAQQLADKHDVHQVCPSFVKPTLPVLSTQQWRKYSEDDVTSLDIIDPVAGQVFCALTV